MPGTLVLKLAPLPYLSSPVLKTEDNDDNDHGNGDGDCDDGVGGDWDCLLLASLSSSIVSLPSSSLTRVNLKFEPPDNKKKFQVLPGVLIKLLERLQELSLVLARLSFQTESHHLEIW